MSRKKQIWYRLGSAAAPLVESLKDLYELRPISPGDSKINVELNTTDPLRVFLLDIEKDTAELVRHTRNTGPHTRVVGVIPGDSSSAKVSTDDAAFFAYVSANAPKRELEKTIAIAFENIELVERSRAAAEGLEIAERERQQLNEIGVALSSERDVDALLTLILKKAREITGADAGSLYLVDEDNRERRLRFMLTQNDSVDFPFKEFTLPLAEDSMAGYTALHGEVLNFADAHHLPKDLPFHFNDRYDRDSGYRTKSLLTLPMRNAKGEVLGVLQLINSKRDATARLVNEAAVAEQVQSFPERSVQLALSLASQAAVSYENRKLYQEIETLFEGFVQAAVTAIEQRDPTTSGHSHRVSDMTCGLAEAVDRTPNGAYGDVSFTREQMKEIRYAALLHDFGKVAVREEVLVKAKKLYPGQLGVVQTRFDYACKELEARYEKRKLDLALRLGPERAAPEIEKLDRELREGLAELEDANQFILRSNEPTVLPEGNFERLIEIGRQSFEDPRGAKGYLLTPEEIRFLSIPQGSLDDTERSQIESHVVHSFNFLMQIPWTREIRGIPAIARAHHEKLNGTGYPNQLKSDQIPLQAKIMTVCDMFDALAASDRPYKRAVSPDRALQILEMSVREKELDPVLFQLFVDAKIYDLLHNSN